MFKKLDKKEQSKIDNKILKDWDKINILNECINTRDEENTFVFYDGPATANGNPGIHHVVAKFIKDSFCKYKTMQGYRVYRKVGWDTHGLPVDVNVEI